MITIAAITTHMITSARRERSRVRSRPSFAVLAGDIEVSREFYASLFGWEFQPSPFECYLTFSTGEKDVAGGLSAVHHEGSPQNIVYIQVDDIDAALARIGEAGGSTYRPKSPIGENMGFVAMFTDPHGNLVGLYSHTG